MVRKRRSPWFVGQGTPPLRYQFFISHVAEDGLAFHQLMHMVQAKRPEMRCFLDVHNWPVATDNSWAIRQSLLHAEFMVAWISPAYLRNTRGWIWMEFAYAQLLEQSLNLGQFDVRFPYIVPIIQGVSPDRIARTLLYLYWQRSLVPAHKRSSISNTAKMLLAFYDRQVRERSGS